MWINSPLYLHSSRPDNIELNIDTHTHTHTHTQYSHLLIVFGGLKGLEYSLECDDSLKIGKDVSLLFHHYLNTCPSQGSRTIRTEVREP